MRGFKYTVSPCFSAINIKTIGVTFNNEPTAEQKAAVAVTVKNVAGAAVATTVTWDGKIAKVARTNNIDYLVGTYTVAVAGVEPAYSGEVAIAARTATSLEIGATQVLRNTAKSQLNVALKDQYGEAMTLVSGDFNMTAYNETQGKAFTIADLVKFGEGKFYLQTTKDASIAVDDFKVNDQIRISFAHKTTGLSATKTIPVVAGAQIAEITFGDTVLPTGKTQLTQDLKGVKVAVNAKDQYGNAVELKKSDNVNLYSSNQSRIEDSALSFTKLEKQQYVEIEKFVSKGDVNVQLFALDGSGVTATKTLQVLDAPGSVATVTPAEGQITVAKNATAYVALDVRDLYGTAIKAADYKGKITATSTNTAVVAAGNAGIEGTEGANYGKLKVVVANNAPDNSSTTITLLADGVALATVTVTAGAQAIPSAIQVKEKPVPSTTMLVGGSTKIAYDVKDQYGAVMANIGDYKVTYKTTSGKNTIIEVVGDATVTGVPNTERTINAKGQGTDGLKVTLLKKDDTEVDSVTTNFTVKPLTGLTYSIDAIPTLYKKAAVNTGIDQEATLTTAIDQGYAKEVVVKASDGSLVPVSKIELVETNNAQVIPFKVGDKWYVGTGEVAISTEKPEDIKATLTVLVNAQDDLFTLSQELTISKDNLKVESVEFKKLAPKVASLKDTKLADVKTKTLDNRAAWADTAEVFKASGENAHLDSAYVWVRDQFGGFGLSHEEAPVTLTVAGVSGVENIAGDEVKLTATQDGKLTRGSTNKATFTENDAKFRIIASNSGKSAFITVTMKDGVLPKAGDPAVKVEGTYGKNGDANKLQPGSKITFKFSEKLAAGENDANKTAIITAIKDTAEGLKDGNVEVTANADLTEFTATVVAEKVVDLTGEITVTISKDKVVDLAGNVAKEDVTFTIPKKAS